VTRKKKDRHPDILEESHRCHVRACGYNVKGRCINIHYDDCWLMQHGDKNGQEVKTKP
jgi:hypothetical protein